MKTTTLNLLGGKAAKVIYAATVITLIAVTSCKKDSSTPVANTVTEADAVELTTDAVIPSTGGFAAQETTSVTIYSSASLVLACGATKDTTITASTAAGVIPSFGYSLSWAYTLDCNAAIPNQFTFNLSGSSNYTGVKMTSADATTGSFILAGIQPTSANYTLSSSYERNGKQTSKIGYGNSFTSDLKITSSNILISKTTQQIISGTAAVSITGQTTGGKSFNFGGTITFMGNKVATLVLNSGTSYTIAWN